jgi:hypothetical protein
MSSKKSRKKKLFSAHLPLGALLILCLLQRTTLTLHPFYSYFLLLIPLLFVSKINEIINFIFQRKFLILITFAREIWDEMGIRHRKWKNSTQFHSAIKKIHNSTWMNYELRLIVNLRQKINREEPLHILKGADVKDGIIIIIM